MALGCVEVRCLLQGLGSNGQYTQPEGRRTNTRDQASGLKVVGGEPLLQVMHAGEQSLPSLRGGQEHGHGVWVSPPAGAAVTCGPHVRPFSAQLGSVGIASFSIVQFTCEQVTSRS